MNKFTDEQILNKKCTDRCYNCGRPFSGWRELLAKCTDCKELIRIWNDIYRMREEKEKEWKNYSKQDKQDWETDYKKLLTAREKLSPAQSIPGIKI